VIRSLLLVVFLAVSAVHSPAQAIYSENQIPSRGAVVEYTVNISNPIAHLYDVQMSIRGIRDESVSVSMPAWAPGAYTIREFARNVQEFHASTARGQALKWQQIDKQTWQISKQAMDDVDLRYRVYSTQLTDEMADVNGPATFMYVVGQKHLPSSVKYNAPSGWNVYTGLEKKGDRYHASDYDIFIDAPAFIGKFKVLEFDAGGASHRLVFSKPDISMTQQQVVADVKDIVNATIAIFGKLPYKDYTFLFKVQPQTGSGGVEHLNSTRITVGENDFVNQVPYRRFLFVVAHEFFHVWNVKRIRPAVLGPFDYTREANTRLLWVSEGITSYYANLLLLRTGIYVQREYLDNAAQMIDSLQHAPGRLLTSLEEASWNTWTRGDNADNASISYYTKGEIVGMLLDVEIRSRTKNQKSLDDVLRYLLENYANKGIGFPEEGFLKAVETVVGSGFDEFFAANVEGRQEIDYNRYLAKAGLTARPDKQPPTIYIGVELDRADGNLPRIRRIAANSPAERAKLDVGDVLVALSDERLTFDNFRSRLHSHPIGDTVRLSVMRNERLLNINIVPIEFPEERWAIVDIAQPTPEQLQLKNGWLELSEAFVPR
jgi:predicted metalloprotease with PDZ domain